MLLNLSKLFNVILVLLTVPTNIDCTNNVDPITSNITNINSNNKPVRNETKQLLKNQKETC